MKHETTSPSHRYVDVDGKPVPVEELNTETDPASEPEQTEPAPKEVKK